MTEYDVVCVSMPEACRLHVRRCHHRQRRRNAGLTLFRQHGEIRLCNTIGGGGLVANLLAWCRRFHAFVLKDLLILIPFTTMRARHISRRFLLSILFICFGTICGPKRAKNAQKAPKDRKIKKRPKSPGTRINKGIPLRY